MAEQGFDLSRERVIHVVGVGGSGMSGIATVLARMGHRVSGSDLKASAAVERLRLHGVEVHVGHAAEQVPADADAVVVSTAIPDTNPEVVAARGRRVPVLRRAEALRLLTATRRTVAVSGTHGKTTTSSMLALVLREAGWRPSFLIGGEINEVGGNAVHDEGEWLVVEADESDGTFVELEYEAALVTNVEPDHLEHWGGFDVLVEAFARFLGAAAGPAVVCADDAVAASLSGAAVTYGFADGATYRLSGFEPRPRARAALRSGGGARAALRSGEQVGCRFDLSGPAGALGVVELPVPGRHNALNAAGAAAMALELGAPFAAVVAALGRFAGVARRFQFRGEVDGRTMIDDYAHLPAEVRAAVSTARDGPWRRVVAVFQPHRFSRTAALWQDFAHAFDDADVVVVTDVYPAGEAPRPGVSGRLVLHAVLDAAAGGRRPGRVVYLPRRADVVRHLPALTRVGDVVLTLGAGDVSSVADEWRAAPGAARR